MEISLSLVVVIKIIIIMVIRVIIIIINFFNHFYGNYLLPLSLQLKRIKFPISLFLARWVELIILFLGYFNYYYYLMNSIMILISIFLYHSHYFPNLVHYKHYPHHSVLNNTIHHPIITTLITPTTTISTIITIIIHLN